MVDLLGGTHRPPGGRRRLGRRSRRSLFLLHITAGLGWLGADLVIGILAFTAYFHDEPRVVAACYTALSIFAVPLLLTVGLVTLPGAFVGVLLGGGTPVQAGAAQLLVLIGLLATQTITIVVASRLIRTGWLLPRELKQDLPA